MPTPNRINLTDPIVQLQGDHNYTRIYYASGESVLWAYTLCRLMAQLPPMLRLRQGLAVNPEYIVSWKRHGAIVLHVYLAGDTTPIAVARRRVAEVARVLEEREKK